MISTLRYRLPARITDRAVAQLLAGDLTVRAGRSATGDLRYLDTADWRVFRAGWVLRHDGRTLVLADRASEAPVASAPGAGVPHWAADLPTGGAWPDLAATMSGRRILEQVVGRSAATVLALCDTEGKTVVRVGLQRLDAGGKGLRTAAVQPLRGYERVARRVAADAARAGLIPDDRPPITSLCELAGLAGPGAPSGPAPDLDPDMAVARAGAAVLGRLRAQMVANEQGVRDRLDDEFLHEYRVAGRRARSMLKHLRIVLPEEGARGVGAHLAWLGTVTGPARDLDVHIAELGEGGGDDLDPLRDHLARRRDMAYATLRKGLASARYRRLLAEWGALERAGAAAARTSAGAAPAGPAVDGWIGRAHRRVLRDGKAITDDSPPESLHDLRKRAKELRYLLECFATLYPPERRDAVVKELKVLQDNLGEYQDCQVQAAALRHLAEEMMEAGAVPAVTLMRMGGAAEQLEVREADARRAFEQRFARFSAPASRRHLELLVGGR